MAKMICPGCGEWLGMRRSGKSKADFGTDLDDTNSPIENRKLTCRFCNWSGDLPYKSSLPNYDPGVSRFTIKWSEVKTLRSMRLTDHCWEKLGEIAESFKVSRADLIEDFSRSYSDDGLQDLQDSPGLSRYAIKNLSANTEYIHCNDTYASMLQQENELLHQEFLKIKEENELLRNQLDQLTNQTNTQPIDQQDQPDEPAVIAQDQGQDQQDQPSPKLEPLTQTALAERLGLERSSISRNRYRLPEISQARDPDQIAWIWVEAKKLCFPAKSSDKKWRVGN
jgi:hypothetical protein